MCTSSPLLIAVTNRRLCPRDFLTHIQAIARGRPHALLLREKDLTEADYMKLARSCAVICKDYGVDLLLHTFVNVARELKVSCLHTSLEGFLTLYDSHADPPLRYGVAVHSIPEAVAAEQHGASRIIAGHIFATESKKNALPKGPSFLKDICAAVTVPVYAIGGITPQNVPLVTEAGARGICVMSSLMQSREPENLAVEYKKALAASVPQPPFALHEHSQHQSAQKLQNDQNQNG